MAEEEQFLWHKVTTNIMCNKLSVHTKYARIRILKYVKLHRYRSVGELYERSIYERYSIYKMNMSDFWSENMLLLYQLSYLMLFERRMYANFIMYLDVIVNRTKRGQTEWVERLDYLFVMHECTFHVYSSHLRIQCIVMSMCQSMNIDQSYYITGVNKFLKVEHSGFLSK